MLDPEIDAEAETCALHGYACGSGMSLFEKISKQSVLLSEITGCLKNEEVDESQVAHVSCVM